MNKSLGASPDGDRAVVPSGPSPSVSAVPASIPSAQLIERLAREASASGDHTELSGDAIGRFAALVADECAMEVQRTWIPFHLPVSVQVLLDDAARAVRKRFVHG